MNAPKRVGVMLCVNDGDHGMPTGHIVGVDIFEDDRGADLTLELRGSQLYDSDNPRFSRLGEDRIKVGRRLFRHHGYGTHVGNWCWDQVWMDRAEALRLVAYLRERGWQSEMYAERSDFAPKSVRATAPHPGRTA